MDTPRVGTAVLIWKDGKVLLGKRLSKNGGGSWCPPGGKLEWNEGVVDCVKREAEEETTLQLQEPDFITFTEEIDHSDNTHFVTLHFTSNWVSGEAVPEENKFEEWNWFSWDALPEPLFMPFENLVKSGYKPNN